MATIALLFAMTEPGSQSRLLALPAELFERVAELTPAEDLPQLRLTCRDAAAKVERTFINAHFTDRGFLLCSKESLQTAVDIARHPRFGPAMGRIVLYVDRIDDTPIADPLSHDQDPRVHFQQSRERDRFDTARQKLARQHREMVERKHDANLLTVLFSLCRRYGTTGSISVEAYQTRDETGGPPGPPGPTPYGHYTIVRETQGDFGDASALDSNCVSTVIDALALSAYTPTRLCLGGRWWSTSLHSLVGVLQQGLNATHILSHLKILELTVWTLWGWQDEDAEQDSQSLVELLTGATQLQRLSIMVELREPHLPPVFHGIGVATVPMFAALSEIGEQHLQHLEVLSLWWHEVHHQAIAKFITSHRKLQHLEMWRCTFVERCWDREGDEGIEDYMRRTIGLEVVEADECTMNNWTRKNAEDGEEDEEESEE
ncbi:hypothetical protein LTR36_009049 [Oleoguttula mirabilis]|uniref:F-box domain-containing protein n=1 Tax=Oleoguttula mirabilis TaxID=1507867 RepID=A0AAV9J6L8_9PEZI|nr:hypothetical protein LTR36_009049 [Oleoguttula mirabilis]